MKILCVSDQIDPLVYSNSIKKRFADVDMILGAGDLPLDYLDFIVTNLNKPLLFVFGNHHVEELVNDDKPGNCNFSSTHLGSKIRREEGLIVAGLGGSMRYNRGPNQFTEFQMYGEIAKLIPILLFNRLFHGRYLDILLTHAPPKGIHDKPDKCHSGFKAFLWFMKMFKPRYLVHGHIHLYDLSDVRRTRCMKTEVINAFGHYIIEE
ncbi:MAG: metallophosphoesterase [Treponema sp.]|jgi:Icc-related predicted phosphoesterase|nr:metallophosphoesterase [Treponema sp.]